MYDHRHSRTITVILGAFVVASLTTAMVLGVRAQNVGRVQVLERQIYFSHAFQEPLVPMGPTSVGENAALLHAVKQYKSEHGLPQLSTLNAFLARYPHSEWRVALLTNEGLIDYSEGYFDRAIAAYGEAWRLGRSATGRKQTALVDRAFGELIRMQARLGHAEPIAALLKQLKGRHLVGIAAAWTAGARQGLAEMRTDPGIAYLCGPMAVKNVLLALHPHSPKAAILEAFRSGPHGVDFATVAKLAKKVGLDYRMAYRRNPDTPLPLPAVVHWRVNHYAAVVGFSNGLYHVEDPTFGSIGGLWITPQALAHESDGYYLIPANDAASGWASVSHAKAKAVYGMGDTGQDNPWATTHNDVCACKSITSSGKSAPPGMPQADALAMLVSLRLTDTPLAYTPPLGPAMRVTLTYNQKDATQPANFDFSNLGPLWSMNWMSYIKENPAAGEEDANITHVYAGGGETNVGGGTCGGGWNCTYMSDLFGYVLKRTRTNGNDTFTVTYPNGRVDTYGLDESESSTLTRVFLTAVTDPQGNTVTLGYDGRYRLTSLTDAIGQVTTFQYTDSDDPLKITGATDPFGRITTFTYANGLLQSITDEIGQTSSFTYGNAISADFINAMTTPYGTSTFTYGETTRTNSGGTTLFDRWLTLTDPLGHTQRVEYRDQAPGIASQASACPSSTSDPKFQCNINYQDWRDSYYWSATNPYNPNNYSNAKKFHWLHQANVSPAETSRNLENTKLPEQGTVWFNYPGQTNPIVTGSISYPSATALILDSGTKQITVSDRNGPGNVTCYEDPAERITRYDYASNDVDLLDVRQGTGSNSCTNNNGTYDTIAQYAYNGQHEPLTYTDAADETTAYTYNQAGQLTTATNALHETTTYHYNKSGYLTSITGPEGNTLGSFTYGPKGRIATATDAGGETLDYTWDNLDRLTQIAYPDGTARTYTYNKLDLVSVTDRLGHTTSYAYDADRDLITVTDPLGHETHLTYDADRNLASLTDPDGNTTSWNYDIEDRPISKTYADGSSQSYIYTPAAGWLNSVADAMNQYTHYGYTVDGHVSSITYSTLDQVATPSVSFTYGPHYPRVTAMSDGAGTTAYSYYGVGQLGANRLQSVTVPSPQATIGYAYDALGRVASRTIDGQTESLSYDPLGRLVGDTNALGDFSYSYLGATGQVQTQSLSGSGYSYATNYHYLSNTDDRRLKAIDNVISNSIGNPPQQPQSFGYATNSEGLATSREVTRGSTSEGKFVYYYDNDSRLTSVYENNALVHAYAYDAVGNMLSVTGVGGQITYQATYNALNEIQTANGVSYSYNAAGELTADGTHTYTWDAAHRLASVTDTATGATTYYHHDGLGRLWEIAQQSKGGTPQVVSEYLWCGQRLCETYQPNGPTNQPLARYFAQGEQQGSQSLLYARDRLGSVSDLIVGSDGSIAASYSYSPWGNVTSQSGSTQTSFGYAGMFNGPETGLNLTLYRAYNPAQYRWLSRDPMGEIVDYDLYRYVADDPVNLTDPQGLDSAAATLNQAQQAAAWIAANPQQFNMTMQQGFAQLKCVTKLFGRNFNQNQISPGFQENFDPFRSIPEFVKDRLIDAGLDQAIGALGTASASAAAREQIARTAFYKLGQLGLKGLGGASGVATAAAVGLDTGDAVLSAFQTVRSAKCKCQVQ